MVEMNDVFDVPQILITTIVQFDPHIRQLD